MKVALVHDFLTQYGGAEKVLEALHEIWPEAPIFTLFYDQKKLGDKFKNFKIKVSPIQNLPFALSFYRFYLPLLPAAIERFNLNEYDLIISDCSSFAKGVITKRESLHLSYLHCPTRFLWADTHQYLDSLKGLEGFLRKIIAPVLTALRVWDAQAARRPDYLLANSNFIAKEIKHFYHREAHVIYPPVETDKFFISEQIENYFLLISRPRAYKKIELAIEAFKQLGLPLKIIGGDEKEIRLRRGGYGGPRGNIEFLGFVDEATKAKYFSRAQALIFPQKEDFGITAVEAMASGRPVIAFGEGGALETVIEGKTGLFFDQQEPNSLAEIVKKFKSKNFNPQEIRAHSLKFDKKIFKKNIEDMIKHAWQNKFSVFAPTPPKQLRLRRPGKGYGGSAKS